MDATDKFIVKRCLEGDKNAFGELVERYKDLVYGIGYHYLGDFAEAEDLTQDVFLQAYLRLHQLKNHASFVPWLKRIAVNLCNRRLELRHKSAASLNKLSLISTRIAPSSEEIYERKALRKQVADALAILSEKNRLTITLYYIFLRRESTHIAVTCVRVLPLCVVMKRLSFRAKNHSR